MATILIADDETNLRKVLRAMLRSDGYEPVTVATAEDALRAMADSQVDVVISDLKMPGMSGLEFMEEVHARYPAMPFILITAHGTVDTAVSALKRGAFDYVTKPFDRAEFRLAVRKAVATSEASRERFHDSGDPQGRFRIIGESPRMQAIFSVIERVADTPSTVLITGESGTGKELVATALHEQSRRRDKPFIRINCAAIPRDLLESEFFGYEQGAFTGAVSSKPGRFELADGGTLLLDEIAEIPVEMQVKLLRFIQENEFEHVGGVRTLRVDVRIIAATNRDLTDELASGSFREDLYYRLNVVPIALPALRDRAEDIPLLAQFFVEKFAARLQRDVRGLTDDAERMLIRYDWPGNIRELENVIERAMLFADKPLIHSGDLPETIRLRSTALKFETSPTTSANAKAALETHSEVSLKDVVRQQTSELERRLIYEALERSDGNVTHAAERLRISRKGLQNKMKELGLRED